MGTGSWRTIENRDYVTGIGNYSRDEHYARITYIAYGITFLEKDVYSTVGLVSFEQYRRARSV